MILGGEHWHQAEIQLCPEDLVFQTFNIFLVFYSLV